MGNKGDFLAGVIIGGVIGAVAGILFAPQSGKETRAIITDKGFELKERAADALREKSEAVAAASKDLISKLRERLPKTKDVQDVLDLADTEIPSC